MSESVRSSAKAQQQQPQAQLQSQASAMLPPAKKRRITPATIGPVRTAITTPAPVSQLAEFTMRKEMALLAGDGAPVGYDFDELTEEQELIVEGEELGANDDDDDEDDDEGDEGGENGNFRHEEVVDANVQNEGEVTSEVGEDDLDADDGPHEVIEIYDDDEYKSIEGHEDDDGKREQPAHQLSPSTDSSSGEKSNEVINLLSDESDSEYYVGRAAT